MKHLMIGIGATAAMLLTGCCANYGSAIGVGIGGIIDQTNPASLDIDNNVKPAKCGVAESQGIVLYSTGDCSLKAAMDNGGITKVHHVDVKTLNFFNVYTKTQTLVYGE